MKRAVLGVAVLGLMALPTAADAGDPTCFGQTPTYIGTSKADTIWAGDDNNVVMTLGGKDFVQVYEESTKPIYICLGDGDDRVWGDGPAFKIHAGSGYDRVTIGACPGYVPGAEQYIQKVELTTLIMCD